MSNAVAKVSFLQGQAWAKAPDGTLRALTVGSTLNDDEILVTAQGARVELDVGTGEPLVVNGGMEVGMSRDFLADTATGADEALLSDASVQEALTVLEEGGDLLEELEETAAGNTGGGGASEGHDFVQLTRIIESTDPQAFDYSSASQSGSTPVENNAEYINRAPLVTDQAIASNEDEPVTGQIIADDIEGDAITFTLTTPPANGVLVLDPVTGQFTFTPNANYNGTDGFVVTVTDSRGNSTNTSVTLNIAPVNDAPTTNDINLTTDEDVPVNGQVVAQDIENDTLSYIVSGQPANGSVVLDPVTGAFVYSPNANYNGSDSFVVTISDGNGGTTTSLVTIGINPVNDAPVSNDQNLVTDEDTPINGQVVASDVDGDVLGYSVSGQPTNGTVTLDPITGAFVYTPNANYNGSDSFVVTISDGKGGTTTSRINIGINPVNDAPVSSDQNLTTPEDVALNGQVVATDIEGDTLAYAVSGQPANGSVSLNPATGGFVYTPNANYNGSDSFVVTISDGNGGTTTSRINIGVTPVNDAPVASNVNLTTPEDTPISSQISASDIDGDSLTFTVTGSPANGSVSLNPATGTFTYSPNANYNGSDSFTVTISDGNGGATTSLVSIGVTPVNDVPVTSNQNLTTPEDTPINGAISASDPDGDTLAYSVSGAPANGSVVLNPATGGFTYTPNTAYSGSDSFVVTISDGNGGTTTSTVNIGVTPVAATTVSSITSPSITEGADLVYDVTLSGPAKSGTSLAYNLGGGSAVAADYGTATFSNGVTLVGGNLIIPTGVSSFTVTVPTVDDAIAEATETLPLSVGGVTGTGSILDNDPAPKILSIGVIHATEGADLVCTVTLDQVLAAPYSLSYNIGGGTASLADYGTPVFSNGVTIVGGNLLIPAGVKTFSINLPTIDDSIDEPTETVPFTFGGLTLSGNIYDNDAAPSVSIDSVSVNEADGTATFTVTLSGASGQAISVNYASSNGSASAGSDYTAVNGTLSFAAGETSKTITVNIADDTLFESSEDFTITLSNPTNATLGTATGTGTIVDNDAAPNNAPVANDDIATVTEGNSVSITVRGNDTDPENDSLSVSSITQGANGSVVIDALTGHPIYTPNIGFSGIDSFTYTVRDAGGAISNTATVTVTVTAVAVPNVAPQTDAVAASGNEDSLITVSLSGSDTDGTVAGFVIQSLPTNGVLYSDVTMTSVVSAGDLVTGAVYFKPDANWNGGTSFTYSARDNLGLDDATPATATITVNPAADTAVPGSGVGSVKEDILAQSSAAGTLTIVDPDAGEAGFQTQSNTPGTYGSFSIDAAGVWVYNIDNSKPAVQQLKEGESKTETFTVTSIDGTTTTVVITVNGTNDAPTATADTASVLQDNPLTLTPAQLLINDTDPDQDSLSIDSVQDAVNGSVSLVAGDVVFTPTPGFHGAASFTYTVSDGKGGTSTATVSVTVDKANTAPVANDDAALPSGGGQVGLVSEYYGYIEGTHGGNLASIQQAYSFINGRTADATFIAKTFDYGASRSFSNGLGNGTNLQTFLGSDATSLSNDPGNSTDAIIRMRGFVELGAGTYNFKITGDDGYQIRVDGVVVAEFNQNNGLHTTTHSQFTISSPGVHSVEIVYWDQGGYATLKLELSDNGGTTYNILSSVPSHQTAALSVVEDQDVSIPASSLLGNDTDADGDILSISSVQGAVHGSVALVGGNVVFTPSANYSGPASFTYTISDGKGGSATATVNLVVTPVNDAPVAVGNTATVAPNATVNIPITTLLANDTDIDGDKLTIVSVQTPVNGSVSISGGNVVFTPISNYEGPASFTYTARDPAGATSTATVNVSVGAATAPSLVVLKSLLAVAHGTGGISVKFPIVTALVDTDGSETLTVRISNVPTSASFNAGTNLGGGVWLLQESDLPNLMLNLPGSFSQSGSNMTVQVISTEANGGATASVSNTVMLHATYTTVDKTTTTSGNLTGTNANEHIQGGDGDNVITGGNGNDVIYGGDGNDTLSASSGSDMFYGGAGNDLITGSSGLDRISGGSGNDTMSAGADTFVDVFVWSLGDQGAAGTPAVDTINNFVTTAAGGNHSGGDVLDLRDLLQGEDVGANNAAGNLANYLHFEVSGGNTTIHISHTGGFNADSHTVSAGFTSSAETQKIVLNGVDLQSLYSGATTDQQIITQLLNNNKLITD